MNMNLWILRRFIWRADACELFDLTRHCLLVQALRISLRRLLNRNVDEDLDEWQRRVCVLCIFVELTSNLAIGFVR